jgi:hypothetical protein
VYSNQVRPDVQRPARYHTYNDYEDFQDSDAHSSKKYCADLTQEGNTCANLTDLQTWPQICRPFCIEHFIGNLLQFVETVAGIQLFFKTDNKLQTQADNNKVQTQIVMFDRSETTILCRFHGTSHYFEIPIDANEIDNSLWKNFSFLTPEFFNANKPGNSIELIFVSKNAVALPVSSQNTPNIPITFDFRWISGVSIRNPNQGNVVDDIGDPSKVFFSLDNNLLVVHVLLS